MAPCPLRGPGRRKGQPLSRTTAAAFHSGPDRTKGEFPLAPASGVSPRGGPSGEQPRERQAWGWIYVGVLAHLVGWIAGLWWLSRWPL